MFTRGLTTTEILSGKTPPDATTWSPVPDLADLRGMSKEHMRALAKNNTRPATLADRLASDGWGALLGPEVNPTPARDALAASVAGLVALLKTGPTPEAYKHFLLTRVVPAFNAANARFRRCVKCGEVFEPRASSEITCSQRCDANKRMEGREKIGGGKSAAERAAIKFGERARRHMEICKMCRTGDLCPTGNKFIISSTTDALDRPRGEFREGASRK